LDLCVHAEVILLNLSRDKKLERLSYFSNNLQGGLYIQEYVERGGIHYLIVLNNFNRSWEREGK